MFRKVKNIYFLFVVLYSGMALPFFRSNEGFIILWAIGFVIFWKKTLELNKKLLIALAVWMGYFVINALIIDSFHPMFMGIYIAKIMIAYWLLSYYKEHIFIKFENVIYKLTIIALFFYLLELLEPSLIQNVFNTIDLSNNMFGDHAFYSSIGIYTINIVSWGDFFLPRNSGFCWEPGPFSSYVILALFINLARNHRKLKDVKRLLVFSLAIITAQSTTSLAILLVIIVWYTWASTKNQTLHILSWFVSATLIIYLFTSVPWLQKKIILESNQNLEAVMSHASKTGESFAPGRFVSFQLRWKDFKNYPIAGFGGNPNLQAGYLGKNNVVAAITGIGTIMGKYGLIGLLLFLWLIYRTGKWLGKNYSYSEHLIFPILILMIGFSFSIIESPIMVSLWMAPVFLMFPRKKLLLREKRVQQINKI